AAPLAKNVGEQIAKRRCRRTARTHGEIEPFEAKRGAFWSGDRVTDRVVPAPAVGIAQCFVRFQDLAELRSRGAIARIDVGMILARQSTVGALDVARRRAALDPENDVEIHFTADGLPRTAPYCFPSSTTSASMTSLLGAPVPPGPLLPAAPP